MNETAGSNAPRSAFVTGATGFVGCEIARQLADAGARVVALSRSGRLPAELHERDVRCVQGDLQTPATLQAAMQGCDVAFHVAADVNMWPRRWAASVSTNVLGTRNVVAAALAAGVARMVFTSSAATIGKPLARHGRELVTLDERDEYNLHALQMVYPHTKWLAEQEVIRGIERGLDAVITHPAAVLGPGDWKHNTLPLFTAPRRRLCLAVPGGYRTTCDVRDVAAGHLAAAIQGRRGEHYLLGGECVSATELFGLIADEAGGAHPRFVLPDRVVIGLGRLLEVAADLTNHPPLLSWEMALQSTLRVRLSSAKAARDLGYASRPARESIRDAVTWFRSHGLL